MTARPHVLEPDACLLSLAEGRLPARSLRDGTIVQINAGVFERVGRAVLLETGPDVPATRVTLAPHWSVVIPNHVMVDCLLRSELHTDADPDLVSPEALRAGSLVGASHGHWSEKLLDVSHSVEHARRVAWVPVASVEPVTIRAPYVVAGAVELVVDGVLVTREWTS